MEVPGNCGSPPSRRHPLASSVLGVIIASLTSPVTVDWWAIVLDGVIGAGVGGLLTSSVAFWLAGRSTRDQRELAREEAALLAAENVGQCLLEVSAEIGELIGQYALADEKGRIAAFQRFDRVTELKAPALEKRAPHLPLMLRTTSDVFLGYLGQVEGIVKTNTTHDSAYGDVIDRDTAFTQELAICNEMHRWTQYVFGSLAAFRSGSEAPPSVEPPAWKVDPTELQKGRQPAVALPGATGSGSPQDRQARTRRRRQPGK